MSQHIGIKGQWG